MEACYNVKIINPIIKLSIYQLKDVKPSCPKT